jgi:hypothetical protein
VLYTGLRHPEIFRALAVMQGNFNAAYLSEVAGRIDPYQPVYVIYGSTDVLTGSHGTEAIQWLYDQDAYVVDGRVPGPHRAHPRAAYEFFARTVRETPWMQIRASQAPGGGPLEVQFRLRTSFDVRTYAWEFGDGETSPVAEPVHRFAAPGEYVVTCTASGGSHKNVRRRLRLEVPLLHAPPGLSE